MVFCYMQMMSKSFSLYPHLPNVALSKMPSIRFLYGVSLTVFHCARINVISFGRSHKLVHNYKLRVTPISSVTSVKELGGWLDETLSFNVYIEHVLN